MLVKNLTNQSYRFPTGHILEPNATVGMSKSVLMHPDNDPFIQGLVKGRKIEIGVPEKAKKPAPKKAEKIEPFSREWFAQASRGDLIEIAEAHGLNFTGKDSDDDIREAVARLIFMED